MRARKGAGSTQCVLQLGHTLAWGERERVRKGGGEGEERGERRERKGREEKGERARDRAGHGGVCSSSDHRSRIQLNSFVSAPT